MPEILVCEQGSPEWFEARLGIPTASEFATILAKGRGGGESKTRRTYMLKLAGEIITGQPMDSYTNDHMERGKAMEAEAREAYALLNDVTPKLIGFVKNGNLGCSPDAFIGEDGLLEIKTALPHRLIDYILKDEFPPEHIAQCQGQLWVTERQWIDLLIYWPGLPSFVKRAERDEEYIKNLSLRVTDFWTELGAIVNQVRSYGS